MNSSAFMVKGVFKIARIWAGVSFSGAEFDGTKKTKIKILSGISVTGISKACLSVVA
jgi:hypothetical protein